MPLIPLTQMLEEKIQAYLQAANASLETLAENSSVPLAILRKLSQGWQDGSCSFYNAFLILTHVAPLEADNLLKIYYPDLQSELDRIAALPGERVFARKEALKKDNNLLRTIFQSVYHYRIYGWILAGISRENILQRFGIDGLNILDEFISEQIVIVLTDGSIVPIIEDAVVLSHSDLMRQAKLNLELMDVSSGEAVIWTRIANLNAEAVSEVRSILNESWRRIWEIMADESNSGALPMHLTMISDFVR